MVSQWEPGTQYNAGDVVEYQGAKYKIVQPHQAQGDWTPPCTPALWSRLPDTWGQDQQQTQQSYDSQCSEKKSWNEQSSQVVEIHEEEHKKSWYEIDDERKKQLEIGGGLVAGLAVLGGGFMAYKHHEKSEEEQKAHVWALQNWLKDAQRRTEAFYNNGPSAPTTWILNQGHRMPEGAIPGGEERGQPLYIARAYHEGSITIGKASPHLKKGAAIGYGDKEVQLETYEILVGDTRALRWVQVTGPLNLDYLGAQPVEGGKEADGTPLYIAQAPYKGGVHPGKAGGKLKGALITYGNDEHKVEEYHVLCYV